MIANELKVVVSLPAYPWSFPVFWSQSRLLSIPEIFCVGRIEMLAYSLLMLCLFQFQTGDPVLKAEVISSPIHSVRVLLHLF